jgi:hypothetical protein
MMKVKAALKIFREIVLQRGGGVLQGAGAGGGGDAGKGKAVAWGEDDRGGGGGGAGSEEMKLELKRLALQVKQRGGGLCELNPVHP